MPVDNAVTGFRSTIERVHVEETGSTIDEAFRRIEDGLRAPFWLTADRQTGGRGRRGHSWVSQSGNLFSTLIYRVDQLPEPIGVLPLVTALAVRNTVSSIAGRSFPVKIKWPNDVLCGGKKISGILIEQQNFNGSALVAIGVGINVISRPDLENYPTTSLAESGGSVDANDVWSILAENIELNFSIWRGRGGFASLRADWLEHAAGLGDTIVVTGENSSKTGIFSTLDENGYLVLQHQNGDIEKIYTGDVILKKTEH